MYILLPETLTSLPKKTSLCNAFDILPESPACFTEPIISPSSTLSIELVVTEKSPLVGFAVLEEDEDHQGTI